MKLALHKLSLGEKLTGPQGPRLGRLIIFHFSGVSWGMGYTNFIIGVHTSI